MSDFIASVSGALVSKGALFFKAFVPLIFIIRIIYYWTYKNLTYKLWVN